jgi:hypothetical protein
MRLWAAGNFPRPSWHIRASLKRITGGSSNSNSYGTNRVNQYRKLKIVGRSNENWFGTDPSATALHHRRSRQRTCAFGVPATSTFGTESNGAVRGPGFFNTDISAFKDFHTFREQTIGFRFDAFNAFNIVSYGNPDTGIGDANFGNVSLTRPSLNRASPAVRTALQLLIPDQEDGVRSSFAIRNLNLGRVNRSAGGRGFETMGLNHHAS